MTFYGRVDGDGQILLDDVEAFTRCRHDLIGKGIELSLRRERRRRDPQLNFYWGVVLPTLGYRLKREPADIHEALKRALLPAEEVGALVFPQSTAEADKPAFSRYLDQVLQLAAEMGIAIADPMPAAIRRAS